MGRFTVIETKRMIWDVHMGDLTFEVKTFDKCDWVDQHAYNVIVTGATAKVPEHSPITKSNKLKHHEAVVGNRFGEDCEVTHRRAIEKLAYINGFTVTLNNKVTALFAAVKKGEAD